MNKRLIIICGIWNKNFIKQYELLIEYCEDNLCDVIIASNKLDNELAVGTYIEVENDCIDKKIFSYKCLEYGNYEKNKIELENLKLYDVCFFVDANNIDIIKFPKEFVNPYNRGVVTFNPRKLTIRNDGKNPRPHIYGEVVVVTNSLWYCNSMEFNIISKFYKGNHYYPEHTDFLQVHNLQVFKQIENYYDFFLYYYIRKLEFNFIYAE